MLLLVIHYYCQLPFDIYCCYCYLIDVNFSVVLLLLASYLLLLVITYYLFVYC